MTTKSFRNHEPTIVRVTHAETGVEIAIGPERIRRVAEVNGNIIFTFHDPTRIGGASGNTSELVEIPIKESKANVNAQLANTSIYF
jgi:hypothetical protein